MYMGGELFFGHVLTKGSHIIGFLNQSPIIEAYLSIFTISCDIKKQNILGEEGKYIIVEISQF